MIQDLTDEEIAFLAFHLACRLEYYEKQINKMRKAKQDITYATKELQKLEKIIYTKLIPNAWSGPKPTYWNEI